MGVPGAIPLCFSLMTLTMGGSGSRPAKPGPVNTWHYDHVLRMDDSIRRIAGQALLPSPTASAAHAINLASSDLLVLACHDNQSPPQMVYATQAALDLWGTDWDTFMTLKWNEIGPEGGSSDSIFDSPGWGCNFGLQGEFKPLGEDGKRFKLGDAMVWDVHGEGGEEGELLGKALMLKRIDVEEIQ